MNATTNADDWRESTWGEEISLEYGKALRGYDPEHGKYRVYGSNGPIGWHSKYLTTGPAVILGRKGAYRGVEFCRDPFWVIDTAYYVVPKTELDARWLYYAIKHHKLGDIDDGSPIPSTTRAAVYVKEVRVPPLREQQAIACILGALDDKIELNRRRNRTLEAMARAIFQSWFVDFDPVKAKAAGKKPPGLSPALAALFPDRFEDSPLGPIPAGWRMGSFTDEVEVIGGGTPKTSIAEYWGGNIPWFSVADTPASGEIFVIDTQKRITEKGLDNCSSILLPVGAVIISARGTVGNLALVGVPMAMNQSCYAVRHIRSKNGYYLYYRTSSVVEVLRQRSHGSVFSTITRDTLRGVNVLIPSQHVVCEYERVVHPILQKIKLSLNQSRTLAALRDALLPKLISGELRVPDAERIVGRAT